MHPHDKIKLYEIIKNSAEYKRHERVFQETISKANKHLDNKARESEVRECIGESMFIAACLKPIIYDYMMQAILQLQQNIEDKDEDTSALCCQFVLSVIATFIEDFTTLGKDAFDEGDFFDALSEYRQHINT